MLTLAQLLKEFYEFTGDYFSKVNMPEFVGNFDQTEFERSSFNYADMSSVFHLKDVNYTRQFAHIYAHRLVQMRDILQGKIQQKWGKVT